MQRFPVLLATDLHHALDLNLETGRAGRSERTRQRIAVADQPSSKDGYGGIGETKPTIGRFSDINHLQFHM